MALAQRKEEQAVNFSPAQCDRVPDLGAPAVPRPSQHELAVSPAVPVISDWHSVAGSAAAAACSAHGLLSLRLLYPAPATSMHPANLFANLQQAS